MKYKVMIILSISKGRLLFWHTLMVWLRCAFLYNNNNNNNGSGGGGHRLETSFIVSCRSLLYMDSVLTVITSWVYNLLFSINF